MRIKYRSSLTEENLAYVNKLDQYTSRPDSTGGPTCGWTGGRLERPGGRVGCAGSWRFKCVGFNGMPATWCLPLGGSLGGDFAGSLVPYNAWQQQLRQRVGCGPRQRASLMRVCMCGSRCAARAAYPRGHKPCTSSATSKPSAPTMFQPLQCCPKHAAACPAALSCCRQDLAVARGLGPTL